MKNTSGIYLLNKFNELLITHPTHTPDFHTWSIPKGESDEGDRDLLESAFREFYEETGLLLSENNSGENIFYLGCADYKSGKKRLQAFFIKDESIGREEVICSSTFTTATGIVTPENDEYKWLSITNRFERDYLIRLLHESQIGFIDNILRIISNK